MSDTRRRTLVSCLRGDDGVSAVIISLLIVFIIIPVAAISIDLSNAFSNGRQVQNAADAAALAGAQTLQQLKDEQAQGASLTCAITFTSPDNCLSATVKKVASENDASTPNPSDDNYYYCHVGTVTYSASGPSITNEEDCTAWSAADPGASAFNVVKVFTRRDIATILAGALPGGGIASTSATATAAAAVQRVSVDPSTLGALFAVCGVDSSLPPPLLLASSTDPSGWAINTAAENVWSYTIWGNGNQVSGCGLGGNAFKGLVCNPTPDQTCDSQPYTYDVDPGAKVGSTIATMAGYTSCTPDDFGGAGNSFDPKYFTPCVMALPICVSSNSAGGQNGTLYCPVNGDFLLTPEGGNGNGGNPTSITGTFLGPESPALAPPSCNDDPTCDPGLDDARRVALVE